MTRRCSPLTEVFFVTHLSRPLPDARLAELLRPLGVALARRALANLRALRRTHPGLAVISVRELLAGAEDDLRLQALERFARARELQPYGRPERPGARAKQPPLPYRGPFPDRFPAAQARWFFARMQEIQTTAAAVLREGMAVSSSHIVISARRGAFMSITASNTDKSRVLLYSQTPLVTSDGGRLVYFGDRAVLPSSETESHWHLHQTLRRSSPAWGDVLVHFHHPGLREASRPGETLRLGALRVPCIAPLTYGSREQGVAMAEAMRRERTPMASVAQHGIWFTGPTFAAALGLARRTVRAFAARPGVCD